MSRLNYLRMELDTKEATLQVGECRVIAVRSAREHSGTLRELYNGVRMTHPNVLTRARSNENGVLLDEIEVRQAILARPPLYFSTQCLRKELVSITDSKNREVQFEDPSIHRWRAWIVDTSGPPRQNDSRETRELLGFG